ncbi:MAG TPA: sigma-70 family RNA polymerase sigma factor [Ohtaekwangia sp.]
MNQAQTIALYQPLLHTIAYNLVRCKEDAEDIVQETFIKWLSVDHQKIENTKAYLIRAVTNNCLNHLQSLKKKKEEYLDTVSEAFKHFKETNLAHLDLDVNLAAAFKVLHTKLEPLERAVFILKEIFDFDYEDVQQTLDKKKDHCRQLLSRAKKKLSEETSRISSSFTDSSKILENFRKTCALGNPEELIKELKNDINSDSEK